MTDSPSPTRLDVCSASRSIARAFLVACLLLCVRHASAGALTLAWDDPSGGVASFKIERKTGTAGTYGEVAMTGVGVTQYVDASVANGTLYCYRVRASSAAGDSGYSNEACGAAPVVAFSVNPTTAGWGTALTVTWSGLQTPTSTDWIGLFAVGAASDSYVDWFYVSCSKSPGAARTSGSCSFPIPPGLPTGKYEFRLHANNGYTLLARSQSVTVSSASLTITPSSAAAGTPFTIAWTGIAYPTPTDWIGLYAPGASAGSFIDWIYVSCSKYPGPALSSGSCPFAASAPGTYQLSLFANNGYTLLGSTTVTVTAASLMVTPAAVTRGMAITTTWSGIATPSPTDWIGLYLPGTPATAFIDWVYVSCTKSPGTARASGSCSLVISNALAPGTYELRILSNNGFQALGVSNPFSVSP